MSLENLSLEAQAELAALAKSLAEDPKTRKQFLQLTKQVRPDVPIPEIEIEERTNAVLETANKRVESLEAKLRAKDAKEELERRRNNLRTKQLADSDEDIAAALIAEVKAKGAPDNITIIWADLSNKKINSPVKKIGAANE